VKRRGSILYYWVTEGKGDKDGPQDGQFKEILNVEEGSEDGEKG